MITPRQSDALWAAFDSNKPWPIVPGARSRAGGAVDRMIDGLRQTKHLGHRRDEDANNITAKGMEALVEFLRAKAKSAKLPDKQPFHIKIARLEAALPARREVEAERARVKEAARADLQRQSDERVARSRERKIAGFQTFFMEMSTQDQDGALAEIADLILALKNDGILAFVDAIVAKDGAL